MADQERVKKAYLLTQTLRDMSIVLLYFERLADVLGTISRRICTGEGDLLPPLEELAINKEETDRFVSTHLAADDRRLLLAVPHP
jgi:hypothetical protein